MDSQPEPYRLKRTSVSEALPHVGASFLHRGVRSNRAFAAFSAAA